MPTAEKTMLRCDRCGEPLTSGASQAGCLNCLLLDALAQSGHGAPADSPPAADLLPKTSSTHSYQHYEILTREDGSRWELGRGAMGVTYKALDVNLRVPVALKIINPRHSQSAEARQRFLREARAAARLRHPNVASVFHFGTITHAPTAAPSGEDAQEECFYAMEFVEGETLEERLRRLGPMSAAQALEIALQMTRALAAAEKRGLVHRDLKPANVMLMAEVEQPVAGHPDVRRDDLGEAWVKVIDFGLAKAVGGAEAEDAAESMRGVETRGGFLGTPQFASPEQFDGREVDVRSDVFSLGVVMWYVLTGDLPFEGRSLAEIHDRQLHRSLPLDQLVEAKVPEAMIKLLGSMLAADPAERPASAAALHERLKRCRDDLRADRHPQIRRPANAFLVGLKEHRTYRVALGYAVGAWIILQVAAIVLPGFAAPPWVLRALMILLALGFGAALLAGWGYDRRVAGRSLLPRAPQGRLGWVLTAVLPAAMVTAFSLLHPLARPTPSAPKITAPASGRAAPEKSVAVLPFDHFTTDKDSEFFADGMQDEVLTDLAKVADLKVISRSSVMQYRDTGKRNLREIGETLGVAYVVEGSVQRAGGKIRVSAQLIDARTDAHKWAEHYDRDLADIFGIQSDIAQAIAGQLQAAISPQEHAAIAEVPTRDMQAYNLYLQAQALIADQDAMGDMRGLYDHSLQLLTEATTRDPQFMRAWVFMVDVQSFVYRDFNTTPAQEALVRNLAETVVRRQPGSAEAHAAMGEYLYRISHDYLRSREEFAAAARLAPNDSQAVYHLGATEWCLGDLAAAQTHIAKACILDPENSDFAVKYCELMMMMHRESEGFSRLDRWITAHPRSIWPHFYKALWILSWKGDIPATRAELAFVPHAIDPYGDLAHIQCDEYSRDFAAAERDLAAGSPDLNQFNSVAFLKGCIARDRGDMDSAKAEFAAARTDLESRVRAAPANCNPLMDLAEADAVLGSKEEALAEGRRALALRPPEKNAHDGPATAARFAQVLAWSGEREEAIGLLQKICSRPIGLGYGDLEKDPGWDPLRGDPRFQALVISLAPK